MFRFYSFFHRLTIQTKLIVYYATFALIMITTVTYFAYQQAMRSLRSTVEDKLAVIAELKIASLDQWASEQQRNAVFLSSLPELRTLAGKLLDEESPQADRTEAQTELAKLLTIIVQRAVDFQDIQIIDASGRVVVSAIPANSGIWQAGQPFFIQGLTKTFTQTFYRSDVLGKTTLTIATPLFNSQQKRVGVLALHFNMIRVDDIIRNDQYMKETVQSYLISSEGQLITDDPIARAGFQNPQSMAISSALSGAGGTASYRNHEGKQVIGAYFWIEEQNAALIVEMDQDTALWPARQVAVNIAMIGLLVAFFLVIIIIMIARRITTPLRSLSETVSRISAGELDAAAPVLSDDEVGTLAQAFNVMTEKLRQTLAGLQAELYERQQAQEELLQFRKVMDESSDCIFMIDPETGRYIDFNKTAHEHLGYTREELGQLTVIDIAEHLSSMDDWRERLQLIRTEGELIFETAYKRKNGTKYPVEVSTRLLVYRGKTMLIATARDMSERKQSEIAIRESEERFRKVFQSSPVAICITTLDEGRLLDANYAYWDLTGYPPDSALGRNARELNMWDIPEERDEFVKQLKRKKSHFNPDDSFFHTDGSLKHVISFYELIQIGNQDCILAMFYDMSVQKQTMHALQQSEARIRALLNAFPDMIIELSRDGTIIHMVPPKGLETLMPPERLVGRHIREIFSETIVLQVSIALERTVAGEPMHAFEFEQVMGGQNFILETRIVASASDTVLMLIRDITQRRWIEMEREKLINELEIKNRESETLRESFASIVGTFEFSEILQHLLEQIKRVVPYDTASIWRVEGNKQVLIAGANLPSGLQAADSMLTVNEKNSAVPIFEGKVDYILNNNVQDDLQDFQQAPHNYVQSWLAVPLKMRGKVIGLIALDGKRKGQFSEHHAQLAVTFANQVAIGLENASLFSDLQVELGVRTNLITELENKNAELERFTYTVSHDLKSPLFTIRGFLGYLEQDAISGNHERLKSDVQRIADATDKMQRLLNELLELSRVGRIKNDSIDVPFGELAQEAAELVHGRTVECGIDVQIAPDLPSVYVDRPRIVEVLQNLIDNAAKFMGKQPLPHIQIGQQGYENGKPVFYVRDNGIGIAPEHYERVFGLFNKLDPKTDGTGIGLALVRRIIEVHGGRIWVESDLGQGSTFFFTLSQQPGGLDG